MGKGTLSRPTSAENVIVDSSGFSGNLLGVSGDLQSVCDAVDALTMSAGGDTRQLEDVVSAIALQTYATTGLQEFPHTRIDTFVDDDDLAGDYLFYETGKLRGFALPIAYTLTSEANSWQNYTGRTVIDTASLPSSWGKIRVTFKAHSSSSFSVDNVGVGTRSGSTSNCTGIPTEILFNSGQHGFTINAGQTISSDWTAFVGNNTDDLLICTDISSSNGNIAYLNSVGFSYYKASTNSYNTDTLGGASSSTFHLFVSKIEVSNASGTTEIDCNTTAFEASDSDPTSAYLLIDMDPNTLVPGTGIIAKLSINNGANKETFVFEPVPILTISGDRALYRAEVTGITPRGDQTVIAYFETDGVTGEANNPYIYGYVLGLGW